RRLRGECLGGGAADSRMLLSLFALQSARRRVGHRRSGAARPGRAAAQDRGGQARGGETVYRPRRHRFELMLAREKRGGNVMTSVLMRSMFVATPGNQLLALEARTGKLLWRYKRPFPEDMTPLHPTSRGVGLYGDKVYFAAAEAVLVAIDARTGKEAWATKVDDYKKGYYLSLAPLVIDGKVLLGASGGELGARGFLA